MQPPIKALSLALLAGAVGAARAGFTTTAWLDSSYDATQPLANGTVYFVTNDVAFEGAYDGRSGLAVAPGAEVVIFVQEGCRLTAKGKSGDAGGAGGSGGNGGYYCTTAGYPRNPSGGIGYGGLSADGARNGQDGWFDGDNPIYATENGKRGGLRGAAERTGYTRRGFKRKVATRGGWRG